MRRAVSSRRRTQPSARRAPASLALVALTGGLLAFGPPAAHADAVVTTPADMAYRSAESSAPYAEIRAYDTAVTTDGNLVSTGSFTAGTTTFGDRSYTTPGQNAWGAFVSERTADGASVRWSRAYLGAEDGSGGNGVAVAAVPGTDVVLGSLCCGTFELAGQEVQVSGGATLFLTGLADADGSERWAKVITGSTAPWASMASEGDLVDVVGAFSGSADFGGGPLACTTSGPCGYLVRLDAATGHVVSQRVVEATGGSAVNRVASAPDGGQVLVGAYRGDLTFGGVTYPSVSPEGSAMVIALTPSGDTRFVRTFGLPGGYLQSAFSGLVVTGDRIYTMGSYARSGSENGGALSALDASTGDVLWEAPGHGTLGYAQNQLARLDDGRLVAPLAYWGGLGTWGYDVVGAGKREAALLVYGASDGAVDLIANLSGPDDDEVRSITTSGGSLVVGGRFQADLSAGGTVADADVARLTVPSRSLIPTWSVPSGGTVGDTVHLSMTPGAEVGLVDQSANRCRDLTGGGSERDIALVAAGPCSYLLRRGPLSGWTPPTLMGVIHVDPAPATGTWDPAPVPLHYGEALPGQYSGVQFVGAHGEHVSGPVDYDPPSGTLLDAGTYRVTAWLNSPDYLPTQVSSTIRVLPATPTITVPVALTYGQPLTARVTGVGGIVPPGSLELSPPVGTRLAAGGYDVTATFRSSSPNYADVTTTTHVVVARATPTVAWATPAPIVYGTPLGDRQLNAVVLGYDGAPLAADVSYRWPAGQVLDAGTWTNRVYVYPYDHSYDSVGLDRDLVVMPATTGITTDFDATTGSLVGVLTDTSNHVPLAGRQLRFVAGSTSCTATTDATGRATCALYQVNPLSVLSKGFTVYFAGERNHVAASRSRAPLAP